MARPPVSQTSAAPVSDSFLNTKKDKRTIKHSTFLNRIEKGNKKALKRRRPSKKLVTTLESLADALPDMDMEGGAEGVEIDGAKIRHKSMKSRPGALKRREKLERMERERFSKNMAQMAAGSVAAPTVGDGTPQSGTASRWAALRGFISQTMEVKPEFEKTA
jgi:hypothetical protein